MERKLYLLSPLQAEFYENESDRMYPDDVMDGLSFPLTPHLAGERLRRRNGKERKRQHRAQLIYTGKSSRTISTTTFSNRT